MPAPLSILIAHDADLVVEGVRAMVGPYRDRFVVVNPPDRFPAMANGSRADIVLVGTLGSTQVLAERIRAATAVGVASVVTAFTWGVSPAEASRLLAAGAAGILAMAASIDELVEDLERLARGEKVLRGVVGSCGPAGSADGEGVRTARLSAREVELLTLLADGLNNAEIGERLYLAQSTVKTYLKRLYRKLGVNTRTQAVIRAVEMGLIGHGQWAMDRPALQRPDGTGDNATSDGPEVGAARSVSPSGGVPID